MNTLKNFCFIIDSVRQSVLVSAFEPQQALLYHDLSSKNWLLLLHCLIPFRILT